MLSHKDLVIYEGKYWQVFLHGKSHYYLGWMYIWLRRDLVDLMDINKEESEELLAIGQKLKKALGKLSKPDLFNYTALGNSTSQLHVHLIPRYKDTREFGGITFKDDQWGGNYVPFNSLFDVPDETLIELRDAIRDLIE